MSKNKNKVWVAITCIGIILSFISISVIMNNKNQDMKANENFKIYSMDINTDDEIIIDTLVLDNSIETIEDKLIAITEKLSDKQFKSLPIELLEIEDIDGKKVAVFNLQESEENKNEKDWSKFIGPSWANNFFQGSAGGRWTCYTLQTTILQPDYDGEWIDGVKFLYMGEENKYFQHIEGLDTVKYR